MTFERKSNYFGILPDFFCITNQPPPPKSIVVWKITENNNHCWLVDTAAAYLKKVPKGLFSVKPDSSVELNPPLDRNMIKQDKPQNKTCVAAVASNVPT
jgi:hypothetical protein